MSKTALYSLISLPFFMPAVAVQSLADCDAQEAAAFRVMHIEVTNNPIFDESAENAITLHRWANSLHINTKPDVILERLPFAHGDLVTQEDIIEAEAILRTLRYLANAEIKATPDCDSKTIKVEINTWDNWSLIPTLSFSRSGGENKSLIGVRDDNLFGLGIRAAVRYSEDEQRSGYQLFVSSPFPGIRHANLSVALADNDDGEVYRVIFDKPFYHFNTQNSTFARASSVKQTEDIFQNDETRNSFTVNQEEITMARGWRLSGTRQATNRLVLGMTYDRSDFTIATESLSDAPDLLPESRDFLFPWVAFEYMERDIIVMEDVYLINQPEDINLGWEFNSRLGIEVENEEDGIGFHSHLSVRKGLALENSLFMFNAQLNAISNADIADFSRIDASVEYFYRSSRLLGYYARINSTFSSGQFLDQPIVIDDDNGVRGFPNQYQHGDNRLSASAEVRWYTDYNIYQLFEVGFASFVDIGRAWGGRQAKLNEDSGWLSGIGIGARFYSNKSSNSGVVHLDITKPFSDGENVDSWEWGLQFRRAF